MMMMMMISGGESFHPSFHRPSCLPETSPPFEQTPSMQCTRRPRWRHPEGCGGVHAGWNDLSPFFEANLNGRRNGFSVWGGGVGLCFPFLH